MAITSVLKPVVRAALKKFIKDKSTLAGIKKFRKKFNPLTKEGEGGKLTIPQREFIANKIGVDDYKLVSQKTGREKVPFGEKRKDEDFVTDATKKLIGQRTIESNIRKGKYPMKIGTKSYQMYVDDASKAFRVSSEAAKQSPEVMGAVQLRRAESALYPQRNTPWKKLFDRYGYSPEDFKDVVGGRREMQDMFKEMNIYELMDALKILRPGMRTGSIGHTLPLSRLRDIAIANPNISKKELMRLATDPRFMEVQPNFLNQPLSGIESLFYNPKYANTPFGMQRAAQALDEAQLTSRILRPGTMDIETYGRGDKAIDYKLLKEYLEFVLGKKPYGVSKLRKTGEERTRLLPDISFLKKRFNKGGEMKYDLMNEVVPPLDPHEYQAGGIVKGALKHLPSIIGKGKKYMEKLAKPKKVSEKILDLSKAKPKEVKPIKKEKTPAMFWKSRDEIYNAPQEKMMGEQWLGYLKARGVRPAELDDSSLEPFLMSLGKKGITKKELLKEFDEIAPTLEVLPLGKGTAEQTVNNVFKHIRKMDADAFDPKVGGLVKYLQGSMHTLKKEGGTLDAKAAETIAANIDDYMAANFGIKNALSEGIVQGSGVPWVLKYPLINLASAFNRRGVSYIPKTYAGKPNYGGAQVLSGGDNTQEFLFRYNPGKLRTAEPTYTYAHDFGLSSDKLKNAFVHLRTTDRTDEFGRRMLFMEEIQSDMHQPIQRAIRDAAAKGRPLKSGYANRADKVVVDDNMKHLMAINTRIEEILAVNPKSPALKKLYTEREKVRSIVEKNIGKGSGSVPQGPFHKSQDYMEFVSKYLVRMAKDGNYDGVGFSTSAIKNKSLSPGDRSFQGNLEAYGSIMQNALKGVEKKSGAKLMESVIKDGEGRPWRIPFLSVKDPKAQETISKGMSLYSKGGLVKKVTPYGIMEDVVGPL